MEQMVTLHHPAVLVTVSPHSRQQCLLLIRKLCLCKVVASVYLSDNE